MEQIIQKAIDGGWDDMHFAFQCNPEKTSNPFAVLKSGRWCYPREIVLDKDFWLALEKECGWDKKVLKSDLMGAPSVMKFHVLRFHEINITKGWNKAVAYLSDLTTS